MTSHNSLSPPTQVNPAILGGLIIDLGDTSVDMSIASRINKLNMALNVAV